MSYAMRTRPAGLPSILAPALLLAGSGASAGVLHVGKHATCYGELPCYATIQAAVDAAGSGDTVRVQAGPYAERVVVSGKASFTLEGDARWEPGRLWQIASGLALVAALASRRRRRFGAGAG